MEPIESHEFECNLEIVWGAFEDEDEKQAVDDYLSNCEPGLTHWEDRATHEWMLSQYGIAPADDEVPDTEVAKVLIQCAVFQALDIPPDRCAITVESIRYPA